MKAYDVVVIGGGPGGYPAAIRAAQLGASVALVEKEALGGTCLNWGCIPTKSLIASSDLFMRMCESKNLGLIPGKPGFDYAAMIKRKDQVVGKLRGGVAQLLKANKVDVYEGTASFAGRNKIVVKAGKKTEELTAANTIIASGSASSVPGFLPKSKRLVDSKQFLAMTELPDSLIVLGGGVIGCEFACMAAQLGCKVTVVEMLEDILMPLDPDVRKELRNHMEKELGVTVLTGEAMMDVAADKNGVSGKVGKKTVKGDLMIVAIGRRPVTKELNLEKAGLETNEHGFIDVDNYARSSVATIYAIGDVTGGPQLAHAATSQGVAAAENACSKKRNGVEALVPACIFTSPEIGCVGLTEQDAKEQGISIKSGKFSFVGLGKGVASEETGGFVKWISDAETGQLLGAQSIGAHATELISEAAVAIRAELTVAELGKTVHCHPTFSEAWMEAAHAAHGECIHQPPRRR